MIPTPFESDGGSSGAATAKIEKEEGERFQEASRAGDVEPFVAKITEILDQATDITVSIESVLFDDGAFVGSAGDEEFIKLKASISAKYDLLKEIDTSIKKDKTSLDEMFTRVGRIANEEVPIPISRSGYQAYYDFFRKLQAQEITNSRRALGDEKAINIFLHRLDRKWIIPFEQNAIPQK